MEECLSPFTLEVPRSMKFLLIIPLVLGLTFSEAKSDKNISLDGDLYFTTCTSKDSDSQLTVFFESVEQKSKPIKIVFSLNQRTLTFKMATARMNPATGVSEEATCEGISCSEVKVSPEGVVVVEQDNKMVLTYEKTAQGLTVKSGSKHPKYVIRKVSEDIEMNCLEPNSIRPQTL